MISGLCLVTFALMATTLPHAVHAGGELAAFTEPQMTVNVSHRQDFCGLYRQVENKELELKDALNGLQLNILMADYTGAFFNYDPERGIDDLNPGLQAVLMDELARRAGFTWRDSFGIFVDPTNETWTELLDWSVDSYDISVDWWAQNLERLNLGIAFLTPWYDSSIILIQREVEPEISNDIKWWNWLRPFEASVWYLSLFTILLSGIVYQWLELLSGDRGDRTLWEWFNENCYKSVINLTQASYEYKPRTVPGRIFGASMAVWALVMTATYTANLASLLVDRKAGPPQIYTVAEAAHYGATVCTVEGWVGDLFIASTYENVQRIPLESVDAMYDGLQRGDCEFAAETVASWNARKGNRRYNPSCDMAWVGGDRKVLDSGAGFATKADSGGLCSGLIRDAITYHMKDLINDGFLEMAWEQENRGDECALYRPDLDVLGNALSTDDVAATGSEADPTTRRQLTRRRAASKSEPQQRRRNLKSNAKGAAAGGVAADTSGDAVPLTKEQMLGTFAFHWLMLIIASGVAIFNYFHDRYIKRHEKKAFEAVVETIGETVPLNMIANVTSVPITSAMHMLDKKIHEIDKKLGGQDPAPKHPALRRQETSGTAPLSSSINTLCISSNTILGGDDSTHSVSRFGQDSVQELRDEILELKRSQREAQMALHDMQHQMMAQIQLLLTGQQTANGIVPSPPAATADKDSQQLE